MEAMIQRLDTFVDFFESHTKRINAIYGGAGSGKSVSTAQEICLKLIEENDIRILVTRKTLPSLRISAYILVREVLSQMGVPYELNKAEMVITHGDNQIFFKSLDDPEKVKSAEFNYIWVEEATEIGKDDLIQLNLRLRRQNGNGPNRIYLTFNPVDSYHHLITDIVQGTRPEVSVHHSTYKDNRKFLSPEYINELEGLINQDENFYRVYALGEPGVLKNVIYSNYEIITTWPLKSNETIYGLDFGYNNPSSLIEISWYDNNPVIRELLYESNLTNDDLIKRMESLNLEKNLPIYADAAEPQRIQEIRRKGYNIYPADKSVKDGIDAVKRFRLRILQDSVNVIGEIRGYKYREDKDGHVLEDPVKFRDHAMDAIRYAIHSHMKKNTGPGRFPVSGAVRRF